MPREAREVVIADGMSYMPAFCINCGVRGPSVINGNAPGSNAAWICDVRQNGCAEKWSPELGKMLLPESTYYQLQLAEQLEQLGRPLSAGETTDNPTLLKLARDLPGGR